MKWWALYREGKLIGVRQWAGKPTSADFGVGELYQVEYEVNQVGESADGRLTIRTTL